MAVRCERERQGKHLLPCHAAIPAHNLAREAQMGHGISARDPRFDHKQIICSWSNVMLKFAMRAACLRECRHQRLRKEPTHSFSSFLNFSHRAKAAFRACSVVRAF